MVTNIPITREYFMKRLTELCLKSGLAGFPKDDTSLHILLKSAVIMMGQPDQLTEKEVNAKLEIWVKEVGQSGGVDRVSLRRELVDRGYLNRKADGSIYQIARPGPRPDLFDESIDQLDISQEIEIAREEMARRKREYLEKSRGV
jgi:hypothetical protein